MSDCNNWQGALGLSRRRLLAGAATAACGVTCGPALAQPASAAPARAASAGSFLDAFGSYRFNVGELECLAVSDGSLTFPASMYAVGAPQSEVDERLRARFLPPTKITNQTTTLLVRSGRNLVLVDTGIEDSMKPFAGAPEPNALRQLGRLPIHLRAAGVDPAAITHVVLTHHHPDHVGGLLDERGRLRFPNAQYYMANDEWRLFETPDSQLSKAMASSLAVARRTLPAVRARMNLVNAGVEIVPGVRTMAAAGHTPGHLGLILSSGRDQLLHVCDAAAHYVVSLERPDWYFAADAVPEQAMATRRRLFDRAASDRALTFASHFPFPSLGHVERRPVGWRWEPVPWSWSY